MNDEVEVICGAKAHRCHCGLTPGHEEPEHVCADPECNGSWIGDINGDDFQCIRLPLESPRI